MRMTYFVTILLSILWLSGCSTMLPAPGSAQNKTITWEARSEALSKVQDWNMEALIAIRTPKDAGSATFQWHQQKQSYHIVLFGPLGTNSYELTGQPGTVEMTAANGKKFVARSPEELLAQHAGWALPVSNLYYWMRGLPVPGVPSEKQFDSFHHLIQLTQQGWSIQYLRYTSVNNIDLPTKVFLNHSQLNVKIIVNRWDILNSP